MSSDLGEELIAPSTSRAAIWARGRLRPFPSGLALGIPIDLVRLLRSGVVSPVAVVRAATDLVPRGPVAPVDFGSGTASAGTDLSVGAVVGRRLGREVVGTLVDPLLGGINAGDVRQLSFTATAPELARAIAGRRSMLLALRAHLKAGTRPRTQKSPIFLGLASGLETLAHRARAGLRRPRCRDPDERRRRRASPGGRGHGWQAVVGADELAFDGVLLAVPSHVTAGIVDAPSPELASLLRAIPYSGVVTVAFAWPADVLAASSLALIGSGVLVPRRSRVAFDRAQPHLVEVAPLGATRRDRRAGLRRAARRRTRPRPRRRDAPRAISGRRSRRSSASQPRPSTSSCGAGPTSFPQYVVGHLARVARLETLAADLGPIALAGAWAHGIGIPACIAQAKRAASRSAARSPDEPAGGARCREVGRPRRSRASRRGARRLLAATVRTLVPRAARTCGRGRAITRQSVGRRALCGLLVGLGQFSDRMRLGARVHRARLRRPRRLRVVVRHGRLHRGPARARPARRLRRRAHAPRMGAGHWPFGACRSGRRARPGGRPLRRARPGRRSAPSRRRGRRSPAPASPRAGFACWARSRPEQAFARRAPRSPARRHRPRRRSPAASPRWARTAGRPAASSPWRSSRGGGGAASARSTCPPVTSSPRPGR